MGVTNMSFVLSAENAIEYLRSQNIYVSPNSYSQYIEVKECSNFNLILENDNQKFLLIKQARYSLQGKIESELWNEWRIQQFWQRFPELNIERDRLRVAIHFDPNASIIVFEYFKHYWDLAEFYKAQSLITSAERSFPPEIAAEIGYTIATVHRATYRNQQHHETLIELSGGEPVTRLPHILYELERISPGVFSKIKKENMEFFRQYQRHEEISRTIAQLRADWQPEVLMHRDLRFNNILLHHRWEKHPIESPIRIIDWEKFAWGESAFDVGSLLAGYLTIWLESMVVNPSLSLATMLKLAVVPISQLQPSMAALMRAYLEIFPQVLSERPNWIERVIQFAGAVLIEEILAKIEYHELFNNTDVCKIMVAKSLLERPNQAMHTVFGTPIIV